MQRHLAPSPLFAPFLAAESARLLAARRSSNPNWRRSGRESKPRKKFTELETKLKMGHGGTLDPMATGVLIVGIGKGTKRLADFLGSCAKSYECVVLFGAETDTYDVEGRVVARKEFEHITREAVEEQLRGFMGEVRQVPPVYSALKVDGKPMYQYARQAAEERRRRKEQGGGESPGPAIEVPKLEARDVHVEQLELVEWYPGGTHDYKWPEEADGEEKEIVGKLMEAVEKGEGSVITTTATNGKRKHGEDDKDDATDADGVNSKKRRTSPGPPSQPAETHVPATEKNSKNGMQSATAAPPMTIPSPAPALGHNHPSPSPSPQPPAAKLRLTVSSGFYVRSLCHDLGRTVGSLGTMAALVRTRQGDFELGRNVLEFGDLERGFEVWGPKVEGMLEDWNEREGEGEGEGER